MNYLQIYENLIETARTRNILKFEIYEKHHIISKCIFDDTYSKIIFNNYYKNIKNKNDKNNLVKLTLREHYIAHLLLVRIFDDNTNCHIRLLHAANFLTNRTKNNRQYDWLKKEFSKELKKYMTGKSSRAKGKKWSNESKKNRSGKNHYMFNKTYEELYGIKKSNELKENRKISQTGRKKSIEEINKLSNRVFTKQWKQRISDSKKGIKMSEDTIDKIKKTMSNPDLNPNVNNEKYKFYHKDGRIIISRKYDMKKNYGCSDIHKLLRGERKICKGWFYKGENDKNMYTNKN